MIVEVIERVNAYRVYKYDENVVDVDELVAAIKSGDDICTAKLGFIESYLDYNEEVSKQKYDVYVNHTHHLYIDNS